MKPLLDIFWKVIWILDKIVQIRVYSLPSLHRYTSPDIPKVILVFPRALNFTLREYIYPQRRTFSSVLGKLWGRWSGDKKRFYLFLCVLRRQLNCRRQTWSRIFLFLSRTVLHRITRMYKIVRDKLNQ